MRAREVWPDAIRAIRSPASGDIAIAVPDRRWPSIGKMPGTATTSEPPGGRYQGYAGKRSSCCVRDTGSKRALLAALPKPGTKQHATDGQKDREATADQGGGNNGGNTVDRPPRHNMNRAAAGDEFTINQSRGHSHTAIRRQDNTINDGFVIQTLRRSKLRCRLLRY
jgi:hypothetical protein